MRKSPADPKATWRVVLVTDRCRDPAIREDVPGAELLEYLNTRDPALCETWARDGASLSWWSLAPLSLAFVTDVIEREPLSERRELLALRAALVGGEGPDADGMAWGERVPSVGSATMLSQSALDALYVRIGSAAMHELGDIALLRARLRPGTRGPFGLCQS